MYQTLFGYTLQIITHAATIKTTKRIAVMINNILLLDEDSSSSIKKNSIDINKVIEDKAQAGYSAKCDSNVFPHNYKFYLNSMCDNILLYGVVRDYEAISYQFTPTFLTSHKHSQTSEA